MAVAHLIEARRLPQERRLRLSWSDGHSADFDYDYLRGFCPCAGCQGHAAPQISFHPTSIPVNANAIEPVGNYGISIQWSDGHATGIYRFEFLRQICPCESCAAARGTDRTSEGAPPSNPGSESQ